MSKRVSRYAVQALVFCLGYVCAVPIARVLHATFDCYTSWWHIGSVYLGNYRPGRWIFVPLVIFAVCMVVLFLSIWSSPRRRSPRFWHKIDLLLWAVLIVVLIVVLEYLVSYDFAYTMQLLPISILVYTVVITFLAELVARIRDRQIMSTLYWVQFFKSYPWWRSIGLAMTSLLGGNLLCMLALMWDIHRLPIKGYLNIPLVLLFVLSLSVLTYFCTFVLSLSGRYAEANVEKIQAEQFKVELITNVSHDIRTPLTSIVNYVDLLKGLPIRRADFKEYVAILDKKAARLNVLISDLMEASKASTGNLSVSLQQVDLGEIVGQVAGEFDDRLGDRNLTLVVRQPDQPVFVSADSRYLWRVLENLFGNITKYAMTDTRVFVEIIVRDQEISLSLKNTSSSPLDMSGDMLAEQFMRGDRARSSEGSGLGLYIAKNLTELMGGRFVVRVIGDLFEVEILFC